MDWLPGGGMKAPLWESYLLWLCTTPQVEQKRKNYVLLVKAAMLIRLACLGMGFIFSSPVRVKGHSSPGCCMTES